MSQKEACAVLGVDVGEEDSQEVQVSEDALKAAYRYVILLLLLT